MTSVKLINHSSSTADWNKYKKIIVYSAEEPQKIKAFHKGMNDADYRLAKDTDPYEFERLLEIYAMECFSVEQCVERLYKIRQLRTILHRLNFPRLYVYIVALVWRYKLGVSNLN